MSKETQRVRKWQKEHYDEIKVRVPKGNKELIKEHAQWRKESLNGFITRAIDEAMERDEKNYKAIFKDDA